MPTSVPVTPASARKTNPSYTGTYVFDNDHPCVGPEAPTALVAPPWPGYQNTPAGGIARVVCYSPRHDHALAELDVDGVDALLATWQEQMRELSARPEVAFVLIFENKGEAVGVSNPHPHCQIYATNFVFKYIETELHAGARHRQETGRVLFEDIIAAERSDGRRILSEAGSAIAFVPSFARYAYEVYVAPTRAHGTLASLDDSERRDLATVLRDTVIRFDNLWKMPFPYVMALHQAPVRAASPGFPLPHRVPSAAAPQDLPEVPRGPRDRRGKLPERHVARREGRGTPRLGRPAPQGLVHSWMHPFLAPLLALHARIRGDVIAACERGAVDALSDIAHDDEGDTIYAIDRVAEDVLVEEIERTIAKAAPVRLVAEGLPHGEIVLPRGADRSRVQWTVIVDLIDGTRGLMYQEAARMDSDRRGAGRRRLAVGHRPRRADGIAPREAAPVRSAVGRSWPRRRRAAAVNCITGTPTAP